MTPFSIGVILRPNTSRKIRSMGVSSKGLRPAMNPYTTSGRGSTWQINEMQLLVGVLTKFPCAMERGASCAR
jgi:hypothetical protein